MTTARDIMTGGAECVGENETLEEAARKMKDLDVRKTGWVNSSS